MIFKLVNHRWFQAICLAWILCYPQSSFTQVDCGDKPVAYTEDNQGCLKCHEHHMYHYYNDGMERDIKERMNPYYIIDSALFYQSNHKNFSCTDCHSFDYKTFPHPGELRMEWKPSCIDCHGGDENFAKYNFERIEEEFQKSVHSTKHDENFTCWMCHNPHFYTIKARSDENIQYIVRYDNEICLSCHANIDKFQLLTDKENPNLIEKHDWLPNQKRHFLHVRCIECHAEIQNDILVAHNIRPKEFAVKNCIECHTQNSMLYASLYKYHVQKERKARGLFAAPAITEKEITGSKDMSDIDESLTSNASTAFFIIGGGRHNTLNVISIAVFLSVILGIVVHSIIRIIFIRN